MYKVTESILCNLLSIVQIHRKIIDIGLFFFELYVNMYIYFRLMREDYYVYWRNQGFIVR